jgi:hypothetical protein
MLDHEKTVEQLEGYRWHREKIERHNDLTMIP